MAAACAHVWIDIDDPPIARVAISPVIGSGRRQMQLDKLYLCQRCAATVRTASATVLSRSMQAFEARATEEGR